MHNTALKPIKKKKKLIVALCFYPDLNPQEKQLVSLLEKPDVRASFRDGQMAPSTPQMLQQLSAISLYSMRRG